MQLLSRRCLSDAEVALERGFHVFVAAASLLKCVPLACERCASDAARWMVLQADCATTSPLHIDLSRSPSRTWQGY